MKTSHGRRVLVVRDDDSSTTLTPTMLNLLIALVVLVVAALLLIAGLYVLRNLRRRKQSELPLYDEKRTSKRSNHKRLTISASIHDCIHVYQEKQTLMDQSTSPPTSPIPEIRITFPEEVDETGHKQSGKVVVVRVGEQSVGMEPVREDLSPYERNGGRFQSLDLERIGGLKEKEMLV